MLENSSIMTLNTCLIVGFLLFAMGLWGVLLRRNSLFIYMSLELMLSAVNLIFVAFARYNNAMDGAVCVFFTITVAAAEIAVGLAIVTQLYRHIGSVRVDDMKSLRH
jgi:NADH-quinone oxidoreductase subunit K